MNVTSHGHVVKRHFMCPTSWTKAMCDHKAVHYTDCINHVNCIDCLKRLAKASRWAKECLKLEQTKRRIKKTVLFARKMDRTRINMIKRLSVFP